MTEVDTICLILTKFGHNMDTLLRYLKLYKYEYKKGILSQAKDTFNVKKFKNYLIHRKRGSIKELPNTNIVVRYFLTIFNF